MILKITCARNYQTLRIYIKEMLHVEIRMENYYGVQSWVEGSKTTMYFIEIYCKGGEPILLGYDRFDTWKKVLELIDKNL